MTTPAAPPQAFLPPPQKLPVFRPNAPKSITRNVKLLPRYISERGKIVPPQSPRFRPRSSASWRRPIKRARFLGLLPYVIR